MDMKRSAGKLWHRFACAVLIVLGAQMAVAGDSYLLWAFDNPNIEAWDGSTLKVNELNLWQAGTTGLRVKQIGGEGDSYLDFYVDGTNYGSKSWEIDEENWAGPAYVRIPDGYSSTDPSVSFMIEIGNQSGSDWVVLAVSQVLSYGELGGHIWTDELDAPPQSPWKPGYSVPEPSSALLLLLGGACVALRRRRREGAVE